MPPPLEDKDEVMEELMKELVFALFFHTDGDTLSSIADRPFSDDIDLAAPDGLGLRISAAFAFHASA